MGPLLTSLAHIHPAKPTTFIYITCYRIIPSILLIYLLLLTTLLLLLTRRVNKQKQILHANCQFDLESDNNNSHL